MSTEKSHLPPHTRRYLFAGILTVIPIWITWWVFEFFFTQLSALGAPWVRMIYSVVRPYSPRLGDWLLEPAFQFSLAVLLTLTVLYLLGWLTTRMLGRRAIGQFDALMDRIPYVQKVYGSTRKLLVALQQKPEQVQRVVLVEYPHPGMKAVGLVTRTLTDAHTGAALVAVYIPTTPNPTSGYVEIVPVERVVSTDWSVDEAMSFIISGGAVGPDEVAYGRGGPRLRQPRSRG